jgi:hypothetical protein
LVISRERFPHGERHEKNNLNLEKGRGILGALAPLIGRWEAHAETPMGTVRCIRDFSLILGGKSVQLLARWEFKQGAYEEQALDGIG